MEMLPELADQAARDAFRTRLDENVCLIAPAGVGKTRAISERVASLGLTNPEALQRLKVVTYTVRASEEMQVRSRETLLKSHTNSPALMVHFDRAFFGTIHSLCLQLLRDHGHHLGLRSDATIIGGDEDALGALWEGFLATEGEDAVRSLGDLWTEACRFFKASKLLKLASCLSMDAGSGETDCPIPRPGVSFENLLSEDALLTTRASGRAKIEQAQQSLRRWLDRLADGSSPIGMPEYGGSAREFSGLWDAALQPWENYRHKIALRVGLALGESFLGYRIRRGQLTFDDQIRLARRLLLLEEPAARIERDQMIILLDEAQDTDPDQFDILLRLAGAASDEDGPRPGRFSMVGDPQQSIYGKRAALSRYREVCNTIGASGSSLDLTVTFRCPRSVIDFVNAAAPAFLTGKDGQAAFVPLTPKPEAEAGQVAALRLDLPGQGSEKRLKEDCIREESRLLAEWLASRTPRSLGASCWGRVAVIATRNAALGEVAFALGASGLRAQLHSTVGIRGDEAAHAWATALFHVLAHPQDEWELAGLLREAFGIPDTELYRARKEEGHLNQAAKGPVGDAVRLIAEIRSAIRALPLRMGVAHALRVFDLQNRLASLPDSLDSDLTWLLALAGDAEASGLRLESFADLLRQRYFQAPDPAATDPEAIQLISAHKAKGGEWDAVILPFLYAELHYGKDEIGDFSRCDLLGMDRDAAKLLRDQETARLLYVMLTRARRTMVLVDDRGIFGEKQTCLGALLGSWMDDLPVELIPENRESTGTPSPTEEREPVSLEDLKAAKASPFLLRVLPHELGHAAAETGEVDASRTASIDYGIWWHEWMLTRPWQQDSLPEVAGCPNSERADREWRLLRASSVVPRLEGGVCHLEMPFLHRASPATAVEGVIDVAVWDGERWFLLDWKTDHVAKADELLERHGRQIGAYAEALAAATHAPVEAWLYATRLGEAIRVC